MTPTEATTQLAKLIKLLPARPRQEALTVLTSLEQFHERQQSALEAMYHNVIVLNSFIGAGKLLN